MGVKQEPIYFSRRTKSLTVCWNITVQSETLNGLRDILLKGIESSCVVRQNNAYCSVCCGGKIPYRKHDLVKQAPRQYLKRPLAVREVSADLQKIELKKERDLLMAESPHMRLLGPQYMYCDSVISDVCTKASSVTCVDDLKSIALLRTELTLRFYNVLFRVVSSAPPARRQRQT